MSKKINYSELIKETLILTVAVAVIAAAVFFFLVPSHASVSSISGLGIVLSNFIPMPLSAITMILNVLLLIITEKEEELRQFIINDLHSGATIYESIGAYNMQKRNEIITIVDKSEYQKLMNYMSHEDPLAFITVYNVSDMRYQPKR